MKHSILNTLAALAVLAFTALPLSAAEVVTYYHNDHLGSPIAATDDTGTVFWQQAYDAWGLKLTANTDERGYTGNWLDEETGLADHKARWYTSSIGRSTGIDPVEWHETNIHSFNRYAYGNNNPYSYSDQNGELAFPVVPILGVMALEALGVGLEVATMEETSDSINRSGAGTFGVTGVKVVGSSMRMGLMGSKVTRNIDDVVASALRPARPGSRDTRSLQALKKKVDRGDQAFSGLPKTQETANRLIRQTLSARNPIVRTKTRNGKTVRDVFNQSTGRGVRTIDGKFDTFVNLKAD